MKKNKNQQNKWKRDFLTIAGGQTVSLIGSAAVQFSLIWWLASETASPIMMSIAGVFAFLPQLVLGPFAGVWVDRINRKTVIIAADLFIGLVALVFAFFFLFGNPPYWSVCMVLGIRAVGTVFHTPAIQAAVPMLVPQQELVRANGWSQFMQSGAFLLGPVLGAAMYTALPLWIILLSDLVGALIASATVAVVKIPDPERQVKQRPQLFHEMKEGAAAICQDRKLFIVTAATLVGMVFYAPLSTFYPLMTSGYFRADAWHASMVNLGYATGMMLCALILGKFGTIKNKFPVIHLGLLGMGASSLLCGLLPAKMVWFWVFAALCALLGASSNLYNIPYIAYMQETIDPDKMGRAFSLIGSLSSATMPLGLLIAGPVAESRGVSLWFFVSGIALLLLTSVSALLVLPQSRRV
ncbi:2-acyl-glycerophospho-ethanolamine acyltransferase [Oxobacter pfennigii]|uniref:2-acyl-glycerophospho-ethanolamine acyltransferase n=1 Tax=Oxobacter pfennigii TaxID=36849 RepID=A0A0P8X0W3_9CLOT|nr:MFS transporter [Oxobacter pfennigii]KPU44429.1 2-acyl-glycerophospho-ethanolamine acyltransferase [Oxobacter pfennigii]